VEASIAQAASLTAHRRSEKSCTFRCRGTGAPIDEFFQKGGNAGWKMAACAMLASTCTMWDVLSWGGETQALIYNPRTGKVIAINALGVAPTGATVSFFRNKRNEIILPSMDRSQRFTGTPGDCALLLAEYGTMSLKDVLGPPCSRPTGIRLRPRQRIVWSEIKPCLNNGLIPKASFLPHPGEQRKRRKAERFHQPDPPGEPPKMVDCRTTRHSNREKQKGSHLCPYGSIL